MQTEDRRFFIISYCRRFPETKESPSGKGQAFEVQILLRSGANYSAITKMCWSELHFSSGAYTPLPPAGRAMKRPGSCARIR